MVVVELTDLVIHIIVHTIATPAVGVLQVSVNVFEIILTHGYHICLEALFKRHLRR